MKIRNITPSVYYPELDRILKVNTILSSNMKLEVDKLNGYEVLGIQIAPSNIGGYEVCSMKSKQCDKHCIYISGRGRFHATKMARVARKLLFFQDRPLFIKKLKIEIFKANVKAKKEGKKLAIRLNVFSDIIWEKIAPELFEQFNDVMFYDYTKIPSRLDKNRLPKNYHLTFSRSENTSDRMVQKIVNSGFNVAIPFFAKKNQLPKTFLDIPVIDGDNSDIRFLDSIGSIVGLSAKGSGKKDDSNGFIVNPNIPRELPRFLESLQLV